MIKIRVGSGIDQHSQDVAGFPVRAETDSVAAFRADLAIEALGEHAVGAQNCDPMAFERARSGRVRTFKAGQREPEATATALGGADPDVASHRLDQAP